MTKPNFSTEKIDSTESYGKFVLSPLPAGFGHTIGIALRRALLSSIKGAAVTNVKINGVTHAFSTISGVKETALEIILNLKLLRFKVVGEGPFTLSLSEKGIGVITGADFKGGNVDVINKDQYITEVTSPKAKLDIELVVEEGMGFSSADEKEKRDFGTIAVDSAFSPVRKVNYTIEGARVGRKSDFDKLVLEIWTDGTINPADALKETAQIVSQFFGHIFSGRDIKDTEGEEAAAEAHYSKEVDKKVYQTIIDELDLPTRVINALLREKIETVEDLLKRGKEDLVGLKGVGRKSVDLIEKELEKLGIPF